MCHRFAQWLQTDLIGETLKRRELGIMRSAVWWLPVGGEEERGSWR
jgi:hypothetical protein